MVRDSRFRAVMPSKLLPNQITGEEGASTMCHCLALERLSKETDVEGLPDQVSLKIAL